MGKKENVLESRTEKDYNFSPGFGNSPAPTGLPTYQAINLQD